MTVVQVVLLGREHRDHRARLLTRVRLLLRRDSRTDQESHDQNARSHANPPH
jgi:hypothetical protein